MCHSLINEVCRFLKEGTDVELLSVIGLYAVVCDPSSGVELGIGVHMHKRVSLCDIQYVCHTQPLQTHHILGHKPGEQKQSTCESHLEQTNQFCNVLRQCCS